MIITDQAIERFVKQGKSIRVGMVGAGFMAKGIAKQILKYCNGIKLVAISNRTIDKALKRYEENNVTDIAQVTTVDELDSRIINNKYSICDNPLLLSQSGEIDVIVEVTGTIEYATHIVMEAIKYKKHIILMNAELDGTIGPILKEYADKAGVVITNADGDQPGVIMNLYSFVKGIGAKPVLCGNIKGLHDPYRNPTTQESFAKQWGQNPSMVTSFADGSKISFEQAIVANGTGMKVAKRGMHGPVVPAGTSIHEADKWYPIEDLIQGPGIVDYVVGAVPSPGVFVLATYDDPVQQHYLKLYKLGDGPLYCFYTPYHLCHFEVPNTIARAFLFNNATLTPLNKPLVEVVSIAKTNLKAGSILDGIGKYMLYGICENSEIARKDNLLPIGLSKGFILKKDISIDEVITFDDVIIPEESLSYELWKKQFSIIA